MPQRAIIAVIFLALSSWVGAEPTEGYYRFPAIHQDTIVFTAEGDLWKISTQGGEAQRLTSHPGIESHAAISPSGAQIAFSAQYHGATEVYSMPLTGGLPSRHSFDGDQALVRGWSPNGDIIYSTRYYSDLPNAQLHRITPSTNQRTAIPLHQADSASFDPSSNTLFFTRLRFQGSYTKRYKGGTAQNIWKYADGAAEAQALTTDYSGTSKQPMWWQGRVYFASDRDGIMNLWSMDSDGNSLQQHTFHRRWDIQSPSISQGRVVYQHGADLYLFDINSGKSEKIAITLTSDFDQKRTRWLDKPMEYLTSAHISPRGDKVVLTARGRIYVVPVKQGRLVELTREQGVRFRDARFFANNNKLLLLNDRSGEQEFWAYSADGHGESEQLTRDADSLRFSGIASPDGNYFAFVDRERRLWIHSVEDGQTRIIDRTDFFSISDLTWSPDSQWLAYSIQIGNMMQQIKLFRPTDERKLTASSDRVDSFSPAFSTDGQWLYFLSDRHFNSVVGSPWGPRQPEPFYDKPTGIYALALKRDVRFPFLAQDELSDQSDSDQAAGEDDDKDDDPAVQTVIDEGFETRLYQVPVEVGKYSSLAVSDKHLFYLQEAVSNPPQRALIALPISNDQAKSVTMLPMVDFYELATSADKLLVRNKDDLFVIDANATPVDNPDESKLKLDQWRIVIEPAAEWRQMLIDAWRLERDYFYDPDMHGVDWQAMLDQHLPLLDRITSREELSDLIAQMVGEVQALHTFVRGGDMRAATDQVEPAGLGALLRRDPSAGGYRVVKIYRSDPDYLDLSSPLTRPHVDIRENDVITTINGTPTLGVPHAHVLLDHQAGQQLRISVKSETRGEFDRIITPISKSDEANLRYSDWELSRRQQVEQATDHTVGYVHLRAMGNRNWTQWVQQFYPVFNRQGLIIDVRNNRGGNIDSWILSRLLRQAWFYWKGRDGAPYANMQYAFNGHLAVIVNEFTASDGEAFAEGFRRLGLGQVIGTRTWGGEIWLSMNNRLTDNGIASAAQTGVYGPEGEWLIEGHGVDPDIVVDNLPHATFKGEDAQLEAAIAHIEALIKENPRAIPQPPPFPDVTRAQR